MNLKLIGFMSLFFCNVYLVASSDSGSTTLRELIQVEWRKYKIKENTEKFNSLCDIRAQQERAEIDKTFYDYEYMRQRACHGKEPLKMFYRKVHKDWPVEFDFEAMSRARSDVLVVGIEMREWRRVRSLLVEVSSGADQAL